MENSKFTDDEKMSSTAKTESKTKKGTCIVDLINLEQFKLTTDRKIGTKVFEFYHGNKWASFTEQAGEVFAAKVFKDQFFKYLLLLLAHLHRKIEGL